MFNTQRCFPGRSETSVSTRVAAALALITISTLLATTPALPEARAATLFWDANSSQAGNGTWDNNVTTNWKTTSGNGAPNSKWTPNDGTVDASFNGTAGTAGATGTVTVASGTTISANSLIFANTSGNFVLANGGSAAINLTSTTQSILMQTNTGSTNGEGVSVPIGGTDITVANNYNGGTNANARTLLNLNSANNFTGSLILGGTGTGTALSNANQVALGNANSLGGPSNTNPVKFARNFSNLLFTSGGNGGAPAYTASYANDIDLNSTGSTGANGFTSEIGSAVGGTLITLTGVIKGTGDANLVFANGLGGGQGKIIVANHATYSGTTQMFMASSATTSGILALGINDALPTGTKFTLGNASGASSGTFDMAGFNQKVAGLESANNAAGAGYIGGVTNTSGTLSTLTISGNLTTSYGVATGTNTASGNIGATTITGVGGLVGSNDNIALVLDSANLGKLSLVRPAGNTYSGGTTVNGGTLSVANTSGSATGSGAIGIGGGTLTGTGSVSGNVTMTSGMIAGTITVGGTVTANGGTVSPGSSIGTMGTGAMALNNGSSLTDEINTDTLAGDLVNANGNLNLSGNVTLNLSDLGTTQLPLGKRFAMISYAGSWNGGIFAGYPENYQFNLGPNRFIIHYSDTRPADNGGAYANKVALTVIPEPATLSLMGLALVGLFALRRR